VNYCLPVCALGPLLGSFPPDLFEGQSGGQDYAKTMGL